jgi:hypothetical protein
MTRASRSALALAALAAIVGAPLAPSPVRAAIETDPLALYGTMKKAYDEGSSKGWPFASEVYYQSTVYDAGRSYALFRPADPTYAEMTSLAVDVATELHYNPLTNDDAALWYVREAATYVEKHGDPAHRAEAVTLLANLDAGDASPAVLANEAEAGALANAAAFPHDPDAVTALLVADVRAYDLTKDPAYRSALLQHAAAPGAPLVRVPDPEYGEMLTLAQDALSGAGFSDADRTAAKAIQYRRDHEPELKVIARVHAIPHDLRLTRTAPADEYFGDLKYSPLGVDNELVRVNQYLDKGWGYRMESRALQVDSAVEDWQRQYPRDRTLPAALLRTYRLLDRVATDKTKAAAARLRSILLVQYASSSQARELSSS